MKAYEIETYLRNDKPIYTIYDNIALKYRGEYTDFDTAQEDCDLFNELFEED